GVVIARALLALGATTDARRELAEVSRGLAQQRFGPEWLVAVVRIHARTGDVREADRITNLMSTVVGDALVGSSSDRNTTNGGGFVHPARAEVGMARKRPAEGAALVSAAAVRLSRGTILDPMAFAQAAAGRTAEAEAAYAELIDQAHFNAESQEDWFNAHLVL